MKKLLFFLIFSPFLLAHVVHYDIKKGAIYSEIFFGGGDPAPYSPYEIYAPESNIPFATGNTDARGVLAFLPDRNGKWKVIVHAGSDHGEHRAEFLVDVNDSKLSLEHTPLYSQYGAMITGVSVILGFFGIIFGVKSKEKLAELKEKIKAQNEA